MATTRNRRKKPIDAETAEMVFNTFPLNERNAGISATRLSAASRTWRKINSYLNFPDETPERVEAEYALIRALLMYETGEHNSRTFFSQD